MKKISDNFEHKFKSIVNPIDVISEVSPERHCFSILVPKFKVYQTWRLFHCAMKMSTSFRECSRLIDYQLKSLDAYLA